MSTRLVCPKGHEWETPAVCPVCGLSAGTGTPPMLTPDPRSTVANSPGLARPSAAPPADPGGKFELLEQVGQGGFGTVWKARDVELGRFVAVKVPHAGFLSLPGGTERFLREAKAAAQLRHPGIATVHEVTSLGGAPVIVSEFIVGQSLRDLLQSRKLSFRESAEVVAHMAEALDYAHTMGLVHRDVKPGNVMIELPREELRETVPVDEATEVPGLGRPMVMDFGLALVEQAEITLTQEGQIVGTPAYMSPEQAAGRGHHVDRRSDVYSLGVVLYELVPGSLPFTGSHASVLQQVMNSDPRPPRQLSADVPRDLETICLKAMAREPGRRYPTARAMADDLQRHLAGVPISARPVREWERLVLWVRRRPAQAALVGLSLLSVLAVVALLVRSAYASDLETSLKGTKEAKEEVEKARRQVQFFHYLNAVNLASREMAENNIPRVRELLANAAEEQRNWEWHYMYRMAHAAESMREFKEPLSHIALSPDGKHLALATGDRLLPFVGTIRTVEVDSGKDVRTFGGPLSVTTSLAWTADGKRLVSGHFDNVARVWDAEKGELLRTLSGHKDSVFGVAVSPDGKYAATASRDKKWALWDLADGKQVRAADLLSDGLGIAFTPDGQQLMIGELHGHVSFWEAGTGKRIGFFEVHKASVTAVAVSPDGKVAASVGNDRNVLFYDLEKKVCKVVPAQHSADVRGLVFSRDGRRLASASSDRSVLVWDVATQRVETVLRGHGDDVLSVVFASDDRVVLSAGRDGMLRRFHLDRVAEAEGLEVTEPLHAAATHPREPLVAVVGNSGKVRLWDARTRKLRHEWAGHQGEVRDCCFSPDGRWLASAGDGTARVWDVDTGASVAVLEQKDRAVCLTFSGDGSRLIVGAMRKFRIWDTQSWSMVGESPVEERNSLFAMAAQPGGQWVAVSTRGGGVQVWDVVSGQHVRDLEKPREVTLRVAVSPDGRYVAAGTRDVAAHVWDIQTGKQVYRLTGHRAFVYAVAFSPDGKRLVSGDDAGEMKMWDLASGQEVLTLRWPRYSVRCLAWTADGRHLGAVGHIMETPGPTARLWFSQSPAGN